MLTVHLEVDSSGASRMRRPLSSRYSVSRSRVTSVAGATGFGAGAAVAGAQASKARSPTPRQATKVRKSDPEGRMNELHGREGKANYQRQVVRRPSTRPVEFLRRGT